MRFDLKTFAANILACILTIGNAALLFCIIAYGPGREGAIALLIGILVAAIMGVALTALGADLRRIF